MDRLAFAITTVVNLATVAVVSCAIENIHMTTVTAIHKLWSVSITVQVVEHHHGRVLGATQLIELIVVSLAETEE